MCDQKQIILVHDPCDIRKKHAKKLENFRENKMMLSPKKMLMRYAASIVIFCTLVKYASAYNTAPEWENLELQDELRFLRAELVTIETASGTAESLLDAPATIVVITASEIKQRGYTNLPEVLMDLPGFDIIIPNGGNNYMIAYQRGYRTPDMSRTLFMINGIVDNTLRAHEAAITRQYPLSNIKHIEVLYGPASAVYGPNAFLGIINIITNDGTAVKVGETETTVNVQVGSYQSKGIDATIRGKPIEDMTFSISGRVFKSDEPDLSGQFGFLKREQFNDSKIWGPLLELEHEGRKFGSYYSMINFFVNH